MNSQKLKHFALCLLVSFSNPTVSKLHSQTQTNSNMNTTFSDIADRYLEDMLKSSPVTATSLGDHRFDSLLDEVSETARSKQIASSKGFLNELDQIEFAKLSRENQVDFSLLRQRLQKEIWETETLREWEWNPLVYSGLPGDSIYVLLSRDSTPLRERLAHAAARCREFPRFFEQARDSLVPERTPHIHAETAIDQNKGILSLIDNLLVPELDTLPEIEKTTLEEAIQIAKAAVEKQQAWLETELLPNAKGSARLSEELYRKKFAFDLYSSFSPEELRARAESEKEKIHQRMYELSLQIYAERNPDFSPAANPSLKEKKELIRACLEFANEDKPPPNGVIEAANHSLEITTDFVRKKNLITLPDDPLEIILMPEFRRGVSVAYCDAPGPPGNGWKNFLCRIPATERLDR